MKLLIAILSFLVLLPSTALAAVTPQRTIPVYSRYCNYGYCNSAKVYHYTPTPYIPVVRSNNFYTTPVRPAVIHYPAYYYTHYQPVYRYAPIRNNYYFIGDCTRYC